MDLLELRRGGDPKPPWLLDLVLPEVGGGKFDVSQLAAIDENDTAVALRVSGLGQATFERLVSEYGFRFIAIELWKCPRIEDFSPFEDIAGLQMVSIYWNQRSPRLWNLGRTPQLRALCFEDFTRLHRLDDLEQGAALKEVVFGDAVWSKSVFETLEPLAALTGLQRLSFHPKRVEDGRIQPLGELTNLEKLSIPTNLFTTDQVAWLRARLPDSVESNALAGIVTMPRPIEGGGKSLDVLLVGKRKPFLDSKIDAVRIRKHVQAFEEMVAAFKNDPSREPG
ncbi:hypothetical protein ACQP26_09595 [Micromonospora sp. CA-248089]|uniref:hypothetical protein n=1 Tax=Micromonospora sp. CA-248089 TaxID=3239960 RepID=UPI003D92C615